MFSSMPFCCTFWDREFNILDCNDATVAFFGLNTKNEYLDRFDALSPKYQPDGKLSKEKLVEMLKIAFDEGICVFKWTHQDLEGNPIPSEITFVCNGLEDGRTAVIGYTHSVRGPESTKATNAIQKGTTNHTDTMLDETPFSVSLWTDDFEGIDCNKEGIRLFGVSNKQEFFDHFINDLSPKYQPDGTLSAEEIINKMKSALEEGWLEFEWEHKKLNGDIFPTYKTLIRVDLSDGKHGIASYTRDLSEVVNLESKVIAANNRTRTMLNHTPLSVSLWTDDFEGIDCNDEGIRLFGVSNKQEFFDRFINNLSPKYQPDGTLSAEELINKMKSTLEKGRLEFEWEHKKLNGDVFPTYKTLIRVDLSDGKHGIASYTRDLSEVMNLESKVKAADNRTRTMLNHTPFSVSLWTDDYQPIDCNDEGIRLFDVSNKQEFFDRFINDLSPKYQPDGTLSAEELINKMKSVLEKGRLEFEWEHKKLNGDVFPTYKTLIRIDLSDGRHEIASYTRDLSEVMNLESKVIATSNYAQLMLDATPLSCCIWDENVNIIDCNLEAVRMYGLKDKQEYLDRFFDLSPQLQPDGRLSSAKITEVFFEALKQGRMTFEWTHQTLEGEPIPTEVTLVRVKLVDGKPGIIAYSMDLRETTESKTRANEAAFLTKIMFDNMPLGCMFWNEYANPIDCNDAALKIFGLVDKQEFLRRFYDLSPEFQPNGRSSKEIILELIEQASEKGASTIEWVHNNLAGEPIPCQIILIRVKFGRGYNVIAYIHDLREMRNVANKLLLAEKLASSDPLTGVSNRRHFFQVAKKMFNDQAILSSHIGMILLDIDHFKNVNDTYGHDVGDAVLQMVTETTQCVLRETDILARYGGEEFVVLVTKLDLYSLAKLAERILKAIQSREFVYENNVIPLTVSAGVAVRKGMAQTPDQVIKYADIALYRAKANGRNRVEVYTD